MWGWTFEPAFADTELDADYWIINGDDTSLGGLQRSKSNAYPQAGTRVYVEVTDLEAVLQRAHALGGRVERARTKLGGDDRWFATALDPTGVRRQLTNSCRAGRASQQTHSSRLLACVAGTAAHRPDRRRAYQ